MNTANPDDVVTLPPTSAPIEADMPTGAIVRRAQRAAATRAGGIPAQFAHAWAWAADWVSKNGVTLPPDTNEYRSLRNWFSYQVNAYNKGTLSERSKILLTQYNIDLSLYRAPNTGRGQLADDAAMILRMEELHAISGSYDMPAEAGEDLIQWQARLLECFRTRGSSARLRAIEARLPGLRIGMWLRPDETPIPAQQLNWWAQAEQFRVATASCQAYAGVVDPRTPAPLVVWAFDQRRAFDEGRLSQRQKGELRALGVLPNQDSVRNRERSAALAKARAAFAASMGATPTQSRGSTARVKREASRRSISAGAKVVNGSLDWTLPLAMSSKCSLNFPRMVLALGANSADKRERLFGTGGHRAFHDSVVELRELHCVQLTNLLGGHPGIGILEIDAVVLELPGEFLDFHDPPQMNKALSPTPSVEGSVPVAPGSSSSPRSSMPSEASRTLGWPEGLPGEVGPFAAVAGLPAARVAAAFSRCCLAASSASLTAAAALANCSPSERAPSA